MSTKPTKILLVEDNPGDARLLREELRDGFFTPYALCHVERLGDARRTLTDEAYDVVLLDLSLPDSHGIETFSQLFREHPEVPVVVLTGLADQEMAARTVHAGAQDYLVKGELDGRILARAIRYAIERHSAEKALLSSERQLRAMFEGSLDAIVIADDDARLLEANPAACELFGMPKEELLGCRVSDFAEQGFDFQSAWSAFLARGAERGVFALRRPDGTVRYAEYSASASIQPGRHLSELHDITERLRAEEALRQREQQLRTVLEALPVGVWLTDARGKVLLENPAGQRIWGGQPFPTLDGSSERRAWWPDSNEPLTPEDWGIARALSGGGTTLNEMVEIETPDGERKTIFHSAVPIRDEDGRISGAVAVDEDVTERRRAEEQLRARARQQAEVAAFGQRALEGGELGALLADATDLVARVLDTPRSSVLELQAGGTELCLRAGRGWPPKSIGAEQVSAVPDYEPGHVLQSSEPVVVENAAGEQRFRQPELYRAHGLVSGISAVISARGRAFGILCVHDTRPRRFTSDDVYFVQSIANVLAASIQRRLADEERARLLASERAKAEQLKLAVREAHHRIKNNLQAISDLLYLELASRQAEPEQEVLRESMDRVQAIALVHDLLSQDEDVRTVNTQAVLERLVPMVLRSAGLNEESIRLTLDVPPLRLSSKRVTSLALIVNELVTNSAKHALRGKPGGSLTISLVEDCEDLVLRVKDDGPGLPAGFNLERNSSVGLDVVRILAQRDLGGRFSLTGDGGVCAEVRFPW
ncbi:MAG: PAS domain S-box protein [Armatimonadota bacterium]